MSCDYTFRLNKQLSLLFRTFLLVPNSRNITNLRYLKHGQNYNPLVNDCVILNDTFDIIWTVHRDILA